MSRYLSLIGYIATIPMANWMIGHIGDCTNGPCVIPVGFGLAAPSGVLMIGLALVLRDAVHETFGAKVAMLAILIGAGLSGLIAPPALAIASAVAFLLAEALDMAVYSPLRARSLALAVLLSGIVGSVADSLLFVWLAFGSFDLGFGTAIAKIYASLAAVIFLFVKKGKSNANY